MDSLINTEIGGRYRILAPLGEGRHALVYRAYDAVRHGNVALKLFRDDALDVQTAEASTHFQVEDCPAVLALYEVHPDFYPLQATAMRIADGTLADQDTYLASEAIHFGQRVLTALDFVHGRGVVHGDVKPSNIFRNSSGHVQLGDFGVADFIEGSRRGHTLEYAAPELLQGGSRSPSTDVWASGVLLFELLCAELPFGSSVDLGDDEVARRIAHGDWPKPDVYRPYLPRRLRHLFADLFNVDASKRRITTAAQMKAALSDVSVRAEWSRWVRAEHVEYWEGFAVEPAGGRAAVNYRAHITARRRGDFEARVQRQVEGRQWRAWVGLSPYVGSVAQCRQKMYAWMRTISAGLEPS